MNKAQAKRMAHRIVGDQIREWLDRDRGDTVPGVSGADCERLETALNDMMDSHYRRGEGVRDVD